jgi:hypothetical protein
VALKEQKVVDHRPKSAEAAVAPVVNGHTDRPRTTGTWTKNAVRGKETRSTP